MSSTSNRSPLQPLSSSASAPALRSAPDSGRGTARRAPPRTLPKLTTSGRTSTMLPVSEDEASAAAETHLPAWLRSHEHFSSVNNEDVGGLVQKRDGLHYVKPKEVLRPPSASWLGKNARPATARSDATGNVVQGPHGVPAAWVKPSLRPRTAAKRSSFSELTPRTLGLSSSAAALLPNFQTHGPSLTTGSTSILESTDPQHAVVSHSNAPVSTADRVAAILSESLSTVSLASGGLLTLNRAAELAATKMASSPEFQSGRGDNKGGKRTTFKGVLGRDGDSSDEESVQVTWTEEETGSSDSDSKPGVPHTGVRMKASTRVHGMRSAQANVDYAEAERLMQRAFVVRAQALGMEDDATTKAQGNLMRLYMAQGKQEEVEQIRDAPETHMAIILAQLEAYDKGKRREELSKKFRVAAKTVAAASKWKQEARVENVDGDGSNSDTEDEPLGPASPCSDAEETARETERADEDMSTANMEAAATPTFSRSKKHSGTSKKSTAMLQNLMTSSTSGLTLPSDIESALTMVRPPMDISAYPNRDDFNARAMLQDAGVTPPTLIDDLPQRLEREHAAVHDLDLNVLPAHAKVAAMVFGEPLKVRAEFCHDDFGRTHHPLDWIGLFRVIRRRKNVSSALSRPAPSARDETARDGVERSEDDLFVQFKDFRQQDTVRVLDDDESEFTSTPLYLDNISEYRDPSRAVFLNRKTCFDPLVIPAVKQRVEAQLKRHEWAQTSGKNRDAADIIAAITSAAHHYDDEEVPEQFDEVLDAWLPMKQDVKRCVVTFPMSYPSRIGTFRLRYFLHGTAVSLGYPLTIQVREVVCSVSAPDEIVCGEGFRAKFTLHYNLSEFNAGTKGVNELKSPPRRAAPRRWRLATILGEQRAAALRRGLINLAAKLLQSPTAMEEDGAFIAMPSARRDDLPSRPTPKAVDIGSSPRNLGPRRQSDLNAEAVTKTRVWAGLFLLQPRRSRWKKIASNLSLIGNNGGAEGSSRATQLPLTPPYDPNHPIESHWLPKEHKGIIRFGCHPDGVGWGTGHPVWPGVYEVRLYTVDPGLTPTMDGIEVPHRNLERQKFIVPRPGIVISRCVAVSRKIVAKLRMPPRSPSFLTTAPLRRELRIYLSASTPNTSLEREAVLKQALPRLRALCEARCVSITIVDLRQRFVQKVAPKPLPDGKELGRQVSPDRSRGLAAALSPKSRRSSEVKNDMEAESPQKLRAANQLIELAKAGATSSATFRADVSGLLCDALVEIEECRPHVVCLLGQNYDWVPPTDTIPPWVPFAFPWLRSFKNPEVVHESLRSVTTKAGAGDATPVTEYRIEPVGPTGASSKPVYVFPRQDHGVPEKIATASIMDLEITSALALPCYVMPNFMLDMIHKTQPAPSPESSAKPNQLSAPVKSFFMTEPMTEEAPPTKRKGGLGINLGALLHKNSIVRLVIRGADASKNAETKQPSSLGSARLGPGISSTLGLNSLALHSLAHQAVAMVSPRPLPSSRQHQITRRGIMHEHPNAVSVNAILDASWHAELPVVEESVSRPKDDDVNHSFLYARHPSMMPHPTASDTMLSEKYGVDPRTTELALLHLKNESVARGDNQRMGYHRGAELVNWLVSDMEHALDEAFPPTTIPNTADMWTLSTAAYMSSRGTLFTYCNATAAVLRRLNTYALSACPKLKPLCVLGAAGAGKSTLMAQWCRTFVKNTLEASATYFQKTVAKEKGQLLKAALENASQAAKSARDGMDAAALTAANAWLTKLKAQAAKSGLAKTKELRRLIAVDVRQDLFYDDNMQAVHSDTDDSSESSSSDEDLLQHLDDLDLEPDHGDSSLSNRPGSGEDQQALGAQLMAMFAFAAAGREATATWEVAVNLPQPSAAHNRLRFANSAGDDVTFLFVHLGEGGAPKTGLEFLNWLADELTVAAMFQASYDKDSIIAMSNGLPIPKSSTPEPYPAVLNAPNPFIATLQRVYGHQLTKLLRPSDDAYFESVKSVATEVKEAILLAEGESSIRKIVMRLLFTFVGDVNAMPEDEPVLEKGQAANGETLAARENLIGDILFSLNSTSKNVKRRLVLAVDGVDHVAANDDVAGMLHGSRASPGAIAASSRARRRASIMLDPAAVSMMAQGIKVPMTKPAGQSGKRAKQDFTAEEVDLVKMEVADDSAAKDEKDAAAEAPATVVHRPPPPLWYLPARLPARLNLILGVATNSPTFDVLGQRGWLGESASEADQKLKRKEAARRLQKRKKATARRKSAIDGEEEVKDRGRAKSLNLPRPPSVRSKMLADIMGKRAKSPNRAIRTERASTPGTPPSGFGLSLSSRRSTTPTSAGARRGPPGPPPKSLDDLTENIKLKLMRTAEKEAERSVLVSENVYVPSLTSAAAEGVVRAAWKYGNHGIGAEWGENLGWQLKQLLAQPSPQSISFVTYVPPPLPDLDGVGPLFSAQTKSKRPSLTNQSPAAATIQPRRRSSVVEATAAAAALSAAAAAARAVMPAVTAAGAQGYGKPNTTDGLDPASMALLTAPARGQILSSLEGRIRTFGDALAAAARSATKDKETPARMTLAQAVRRSSSVGLAAKANAAPKPLPIQATSPLDIADREAIQPRTGDTLEEALVRILTQDLATEVPKDGKFGAEFDLRTAASAAAQKSALHRRPQFLRLALARLALCTTPDDALSAASRLRLCSSIDDAMTEYLTVLEAEYPLAIEVLCFLRVSARGLQEQELIDLLGGGQLSLYESPHVRPPIVHDRALQSIMQVQVTHASLSRQYQSALVHAMASVSNQIASQVQGAGKPEPGDDTASVSKGMRHVNAAVPMHPSLLPKCLIIPPKSAPIFTPRLWCTVRRILLSCAVVRSRGVWCLDGGAVRTGIDRWLLPSRAQRLVYLQHISAYFWLQPAGLRKAEELVPALISLADGARQGEAKDPLWRLPSRTLPTSEESDQSLSLVPYGIVPGDFLTPAAMEALSVVEANHRLATRLAVALRSTGAQKGKKAEAVAEPEPAYRADVTLSAVDRAEQQRAAVYAALATGSADALRSVAVAQVTSLLERRPSYMLLSGWPPSAAFPSHEALLAGSLLTVCTDIRFLMFVDRAGEPLRNLALQGLLNTLRSSVQLSAALRVSFEAFHGICGYDRSPQYHLLRGCIIDPNFSKELEDMDSMSQMRRTRDGAKAPSVALGGIFVDDNMFMGIRKKGVKQLYIIASMLLELGQYAGAQSMLESSILLNLAGYDAREDSKAAANRGPKLSSNSSAPQPLIKALSPLVPGFQSFVQKLADALDLLGRPPADIDSVSSARDAPVSQEALDALQRIHLSPRPPPRRPDSASTPSEMRTPKSHDSRGFFKGLVPESSPTATPVKKRELVKEVPPMVAGHAAWDIPTFSMSHMLALSMGKKKSAGSPAASDDEDLQDREGEDARITLPSVSVSTLAATKVVAVAGRDTPPSMVASKVVEDIDSIISRVGLHGRRIPALPAKGNKKDTTGLIPRHVSQEARTNALLVAVVKSAVKDADEAVKLLQEATAQVDGETTSNKRLHHASSRAALLDTSTKPADKAAEDEAQDLSKLGFGASTAASPHIMNVELLSAALAKLALLYAERLQAYLQFLSLQLAAHLAHGGRLVIIEPPKQHRRRSLSATQRKEAEPSTPRDRHGRRLSTVFPLANQDKVQVGAKFEVHPQHVANKLLAVHKMSVQLDRVVGPRHPELVKVGRAMRQAQEIRAELLDMGFLLVLEEEAGLLAIRRRRPKSTGAGGRDGSPNKARALAEDM